MRTNIRVAATVTTIFALTACGDAGIVDDGATPAPTATASASTTPDNGGVTLEQPAIWPAADVVLDSPSAAAADFVTGALAVPATLGEYQAGDSRSGEIEVRFAGEGGGTEVTRGLLLLRQLGPDNSWFVLAAPNDVVTIATPEQGGRLTPGPVTVQGVARGFEGAVTVTAFVAGDRSAVIDQQHTVAGSMEQPEPYEVTLDLTAAADGDTVAILVQGGTGLETDPGDFAAIAVVIEPAP